MTYLTPEEKKYLIAGMFMDEISGGGITCIYPPKETADIVFNLATGNNMETAKKLAAFWKNYFKVSPQYAKEVDAAEQAQLRQQAQETLRKAQK